MFYVGLRRGGEMGQTSIESDNERADPKLFELFVTPNSVMVPPKLPALGSIPE